MGDQYDSPNQQVVRPDGSGPSDEGAGGSVREGEAAAAASPQPVDDYDAMTKDELIALAQERGISPANVGMTKDELKAALTS